MAPTSKRQAAAALLHFFDTYFPDHQAGLDELVEWCVYKRYDKHQFLLEVGQEERHLRFLVSGMVRVFYQYAGQESNIHFYVQPGFISDIPAFLQHTSTRQTHQALTTVELLVLERERYEYIVARYTCGKGLMQQYSNQLFHEQQAREQRYRTLSPEERYQYLLTHKAHWLATVPQYHIASYLGITPETLSRIRRRIS